jgi:23S rRNA pseudouridine1911/1915/1917 synthase
MQGNRFSIICDAENQRLDIFLSERLSLTRTRVKVMIDGGHVRVGGKIVKPSTRVKKGLFVEGEIVEEEPATLEPEDIPLRILYEDQYFLAVDKPGGMVVHPSFGHKGGTLVNAVLAYLGEANSKPQALSSKPQALNTKPQAPSSKLETPKNTPETLNARRETRNAKRETRDALPNLRPGIVHRLDKGTTGVILVAKDPVTQERLSAMFKERSVEKVYRAVVEGMVRNDLGVVEGNIGRHPTERKRMAVLKKGGRSSYTAYKVLERLDGFTSLEAYPRTGRTHQIRVHLAHMGHPVAGDETYGRKAKNVAPRPLLHAHRIAFIHPFTGEPVSIEAPLPVDMEDFIACRRRPHDKGGGIPRG